MSNKPQLDPKVITEFLGTIRSFTELLRDPSGMIPEKAQKVSTQAFDTKSKLLGQLTKR